MNTILGGVMTAMVTAPLCFFLYELYNVADSVAIKTSPVMKENDDSSMVRTPECSPETLVRIQ